MNKGAMNNGRAVSGRVAKLAGGRDLGAVGAFVVSTGLLLAAATQVSAQSAPPLLPDVKAVPSDVWRPPQQVLSRLPEKMPAHPEPGKTIEFYVTPTTSNRFSIDPASISFDGEKVARMTVVVVSPSGARNISYEAFRCDQTDRALLAIGRPDGGWSPVANPSWRPVSSGDMVNRHYVELWRSACDGRAVARSVPDLLERLQTLYKVINP